MFRSRLHSHNPSLNIHAHALSTPHAKLGMASPMLHGKRLSLHVLAQLQPIASEKVSAMDSVHSMRLRTVRPKSDEDEEEPTFRFGDFPAELRNHVYECAARADRKLAVSEESATGVRALAQVSKLHRKECVAVIQDRAIKEPSTIVVKVIDFDFTEAMRATDRLLLIKATLESFPSDGLLPKLLLQLCTTSRHDGDIQNQIRGVEKWLRYLRKLDEDEKWYDEYYGYEIATIVSMGEALDIVARVDMSLKTSGHFSILHSILYTWEAKQNDAQEGRSQIIGFFEDLPECASDDEEEYEPEEPDAEHVGDL